MLPDEQKPVVKMVDVPRTLLAQLMLAHSEFYEACGKATVGAELEVLAKYLEQMKAAVQTAAKRLLGA